MFSSVSKLLKESVDTASAGADQLYTQAKNSVTNNGECHECKSSITIFGSLKKHNTCRMCCKIFCAKCLTKSDIVIPNHLVDIEFQSKKNPPTMEQQLLCSTCTTNALSMCMDIFKTEMYEKFGPLVDKYLEATETPITFFEKPSSSPKDSTFRKALRLSVVTEYVADLTGFTLTYKAVKFAIYGRELFNVIMTGGLYAALSPLMESLKTFDISGPNGLMRVYYLGCQHTLTNKMHNVPRVLQYESKEPGVIMQNCPDEVLSYIRRYVTPAHWLYVSSLPPPHDDNDWSCWYLSRIIKPQGWTLLVCINDTRRIPDGSKCPAFALVVRGGVDGKKKEAMLVVRGSKSAMDWAINFEESLSPFEYTYKNPLNPSDLITVKGSVHQGIRTGALGILDGYNLRHYLMRLYSNGYDIKIVGHSLGAGVATIIAAEMRSTVTICEPEKTGFDAKVSETHTVSAVVYSSPACITVELADAFRADRLVVNVVFGNDIVPRVSHPLLAILAQEVIQFGEQSAKWMAQDKQDLSNYISSLGKASDFHASYDTTDEKTEKEEKNVPEASAPPLDDQPTDTPTEKPLKPVKPTKPSKPTNSVAEPKLNTETEIGNVAEGKSMDSEKQKKEIERAKAKSVLTVTPSPIIHLYKEINGTIRAAVVTHEHSAFKKIELLPSKLLEEHKIISYRNAIDTARYTTGLEGKNESVKDIPRFFNLPKDLKGVSVGEKRKKSAYRQSLFVSNAVKAEEKGNPDTSGNLKWSPCSVCGADCTWPYMLHSDANRALATHICSSCGGVVCSACAPAGDKLPGDGYTKEYKLPDLRIALPEVGVYTPQRVCLPCYFQE